jgi:hypothetical protein
MKNQIEALITAHYPEVGVVNGIQKTPDGVSFRDECGRYGAVAFSGQNALAWVAVLPEWEDILLNFLAE